MIHCKKQLITAFVTVWLPMTLWSQAPVIEDSDNFAMAEEQQAYEAPVVSSKYDEPPMQQAQNERPRGMSHNQDDGPALVKEDAYSEPKEEFNDNAKLIDKVQSLQQEVQELRGQLEVQAHDLKLLQQQQIAFYKDLDARLGTSSAKSAQMKPPTELNIGAKPAVNPPAIPAAQATSTTLSKPAIALSRANPADEQISYMAAYELVKNKRYGAATGAMTTFVQKYPQGSYTANAQYWLGELYLVQRDYLKSIQHFDVVRQQFPSSNKAAASLLKSGYAYAASGNKQEAAVRFQQVIKTYPGTPTAKLAKLKLETIHVK